MQTYRLEWNLCQINGVLNFTYTSYEAHMESLISRENGFQWFYEKNMFNWWKSEIGQKLTVSIAAIQTYFQKW